ncbi:tRNA delta(2)-isopentenylpyrophosphate transferase [Haloferula helveola]|uniref:tRNA dimethylallyltransferase n=1 Tax=Haloferula helveola TaxID=490095 RepID=A0ABM7RJL8_9BACT|nr:tRNA delta(2)-isopentenylpyrophosphate transferase [Haloferula helveola]
MRIDRPVFLCGPTASGKSSLAIELARRIDGEVINGDAFQLYRGAPVITAAPSPAEMAEVPHHLYAVLNPAETCDAMRYRDLALPVLEDVLSRGRTPIVTGGSGLYLKFLTHGPSPLPPGDTELRGQLDAEPLDVLVSRLTELDPVEAARTNLTNRRYVSRALEICLLAGRPCSELRDGWERRTSEIDRSLLGIFIQRERPDLHRRIELRTRQMMEGGAVEEVASLTEDAAGLGKAIGIPQIRDHLAGRTDKNTCADLIEAATRQYAKRQETWFRREQWLRPVRWEPDTPPPVERALQLLQDAQEGTGVDR